MYEGRLNDGRTALAHDVVVNVTNGGLDIRTPDNSVVQLWPFDDLRLINAATETPLRLTRSSDMAPRLIVADPLFRSALLPRAPTLSQRPSVVSLRGIGLVLGSLIGAALFSAGLWFGLPLLAKPIAALVPPAAEARLGQQVTAVLTKDLRVCTQPAGEAAMRTLVARLAPSLDGPRKFEVRVVEKSIVNAFAAPGGTIVFFSGLIDQAESAEEVAGVLAHEMAHVVHRHGTQALVRHFALSTILTLVTGNDWGVGTVASSTGQMLLHLAHSRAAEAEADAAAVRILQAARVSSDGLTRFMARQEKIRPAGDRIAALHYLDSHPSLAERREALARIGIEGPPALNAKEWADLRAICRK